ncbi:MAG TPA: MFS transporter [Ktedonobacteraceae bacterium]|nr:MFS transporter [Ktedonobacteraceae bacterium]
METSKNSLSLWRNRDYLLLWGGQTLSNIGSGISGIAYPLLVLAITGSPAQAGLVGGLRSLMYILLILPAGALLDRWNRKQVMIICDTVRAISLASIPVAALLGHLMLVQLYVIAFIEGTFEAFFDIAEVSSVPQVVSQEQLPAAMSRVQVTAGLTTLLGPSLGGILFAIRSLLPFLADAISYVISVVTLSFIRVPFQRQRSATGTTKRSLRREIGEGLRWLWNQPVLRSMAFITSGNIFFGAGQALIIIVIAQRQHALDTTIGLIFGIAGIGTILGAIMAEAVSRRFSFAQNIIGVLWLFVVFWLPLALLPSPLILGLLTAALFFIGPFYSVTSISYRLAITPDELQSRVNSVARLIALGLSPIGQALTGILLQYSGPQTTVLLLTAGQVVLPLVAMVNRPIRNVHLPDRCP